MVEESLPTRSGQGSGGGWSVPSDGIMGPTPITEIQMKDVPRILTGFAEFDRVLGGGLVPGSLVLVGGDPGIGKSTLMLQTAHLLSAAGYRVLYVTGEESPHQIRMRAERLGALSENLLLLPETDLERMESAIATVKPEVLIVDSIQTMFSEAVGSAPGSVAQVRESTAHLLRLAKRSGIAIFIVGHVTKEGAIAGPRMLEHMVDAVLYFEGERHHTYRIIRAVKNRFGSTNELGIFEMRDRGLIEVLNPSELFLSERGVNQPGSVVVATMEGSRPVLVEVQALVCQSAYGTPRRHADGVDPSRVSMMMAVLEKRNGLYISAFDAYLNVAGGVKVDEPAVDLGIALSIASSYKDRPMSSLDVVMGEIGLTGEVRGVARIDGRIREALKLGFERCIVPASSIRGYDIPTGIQVVAVHTLQEALQAVIKG